MGDGELSVFTCRVPCVLRSGYPSQAVTIPFTIGGLFAGASYFGSLEMDPTKPILGLEPMIFYTGCTVACMGESTISSLM